jgi:hypothetical protein
MVNQTDVQMYTGYHYDFGVFRVFGILSGEVRFFREIREISLLQTRRVMKNSILLKKFDLARWKGDIGFCAKIYTRYQLVINQLG